MKGKLFLRVGLLLFAAILLGSAATYAIAQPQLAGTEARAQVSSHFLWLLPIALCLAAAGGWAVARGIVDPIRKIDPETPGTEAPYEELVPLLARIRAAGNPVAETVAGWLDFFFAFHRTKGYAGAPVHDAVAVCALLRPDLLHFEDWHVTVETQGAFCRGATVGDRRTAPNARVITGIDREGFAELLTEAVRTYG